MRKIMIGMPSYSGEAAIETMASVIEARDEAKALGYSCDFVARRGEMVHFARNILIGKFLHSGAETLVFWDADVAAAPGAFERLIGHEVDVVFGAYRFRSDPEAYPLNIPPEGFVEQDGLLEVREGAAGFMAISRRAILRLVARYPGLWCEVDGIGRVPWLFDFGVRENRAWSEDYGFCHRWREAGGQVWLDPDIRLLHIGPKGFAGDFNAWLGRRLAQRETPASLAAARAKLDAAYARALAG